MGTCYTPESLQSEALKVTADILSRLLANLFLAYLESCGLTKNQS